MNTPPRDETVAPELHEEERREEDLGANARRCRMCEGIITPPATACGELERAKAAAALAGYCSLVCMSVDAADIVARGEAWWQKEARRHG